MEVVATRHPNFCRKLGHPTPDGLQAARNTTQPHLNGNSVIVSTGVPRTDHVGLLLHEVTNRPHLVRPGFGPIRVPLAPGPTLYDLISNTRFVKSGMWLWSRHLLPRFIEQPEEVTSRVAAEIQELLREGHLSVLLLTHLEILAVLEVLSGYAKSLPEAISLDAPHLHTRVFNF